jgi:hypothetical protein
MVQARRECIKPVQQDATIQHYDTIDISTRHFYALTDHLWGIFTNYQKHTKGLQYYLYRMSHYYILYFTRWFLNIKIN